jgi:hypothetical protein
MTGIDKEYWVDIEVTAKMSVNVDAWSEEVAVERAKVSLQNDMVEVGGFMDYAIKNISVDQGCTKVDPPLPEPDMSNFSDIRYRGSYVACDFRGEGMIIWEGGTLDTEDIGELSVPEWDTLITGVKYLLQKLKTTKGSYND